ncbi:hypothetical protein BDK51DRAFT_44692 [Blyttiomyces helicus]|uniref:Uncharacterized protein n=1 Tax=Blyttiomyces helicus TaxID=388810 RepID=A0A4P9W651_9FUNG|nr:hypothetical protein BDK51DRAFT_44692 [Blyttiomyces helicus]|eukprot:RKO86833.1 hypothetical protein BDK51DRAFT_44692 [Blyttiomyces helicus]
MIPREISTTGHVAAFSIDEGTSARNDAPGSGDESFHMDVTKWKENAGVKPSLDGTAMPFATSEADPQDIVTSLALSGAEPAVPPHRRQTPSIPFEIIRKILHLCDRSQMVCTNRGTRTIVVSAPVSRIWAAAAKDLIWEQVSVFRPEKFTQFMNACRTAGSGGRVRRLRIATDRYWRDDADLAEMITFMAELGGLRTLRLVGRADIRFARACLLQCPRMEVLRCDVATGTLPVARGVARLQLLDLGDLSDATVMGEVGEFLNRHIEPAIEYWRPGRDPGDSFCASTAMPEFPNLETLDHPDLNDDELVAGLGRTCARIRHPTVGARCGLLVRNEAVINLVRLLSHFWTIKALSLLLREDVGRLTTLIAAKELELRVLDLNSVDQHDADPIVRTLAFVASHVPQLEAIGLSRTGSHFIKQTDQGCELPFEAIEFLEEMTRKCPRLHLVVLLNERDTLDCRFEDGKRLVYLPMRSRALLDRVGIDIAFGDLSVTAGMFERFA